MKKGTECDNTRGSGGLIVFFFFVFIIGVIALLYRRSIRARDAMDNMFDKVSSGASGVTSWLSSKWRSAASGPAYGVLPTDEADDAADAPSTALPTDAAPVAVHHHQRDAMDADDTDLESHHDSADV